MGYEEKRMSIYEQNLAVLQETRADLYRKMIDSETDTENAGIRYSDLYVGDALDGEKFLAVVDGKDIVPLASTYCSAHAAERYIAQYEKKWTEQTLLLFGMGNVAIVDCIFSGESPIGRCIIYEPSKAIFKKILEEYDLKEILRNSQLTILVAGINGDELETTLYNVLNYENWRYFFCSSAPNYSRLFAEEWEKVQEIANRVAANREAELNTLGNFAKAGLENEIKAFYWMIDSVALNSMANVFPENLPCIVVAAGPSLEKNVEVLRQAKGKAFIICVDTALTFLLERGIVPDMACTMDAQKGPSYFVRPELSEIPMVVSTDSDYRALESIKDVKTIYCATTSDFHQRLYRDKGWNVDYFDGGGSVGTICFAIGVRLGFKTIILIGQDLAFTDKKSHAGTGDLSEDDLIYGMLWVDGYYGDRVITRMDFKHYIDWYNMKIPQLKDRTVINATEGGARLDGARQMPLQEAVNQYCIEECDIKQIMEKLPKVWNSKEEKQQYYEELKREYYFFISFRRRLKEGIEGAKRGIVLLERGDCQNKELQKIDRILDSITQMVATEEGVLMLVKRTINGFVTLADDLLDKEENLDLEGIRLYKKMQGYLQELLDAVNELLPLWEEVMDRINEKYKFE